MTLQTQNVYLSILLPCQCLRHDAGHGVRVILEHTDSALAIALLNVMDHAYVRCAESPLTVFGEAAA